MAVVAQDDVEQLLDIIVIGGGINGTGVAADAAGRGLKVALFEAADFAGATSSSSTKLIHGGLRYLEHYEFRMVAEALAEREVLLSKAPHIAYPLRFRLPHEPHLRPKWMIKSGLFLYDHLSKSKKLSPSCQINLANSSALKPEFKQGFEYSDAWVDDARLVILNVLHARQFGASVHNYCKVERAQQIHGLWQVSLVCQLTGERFERRSKALINVAGPWVTDIFDKALAIKSPRKIRLVKGSHLVVPRFYQEPQAYLLQNKDGRVVFVIPYLDKFSMIGTTDVEFRGDPHQLEVSAEEIDYLLSAVNRYMAQSVSKADIVWQFCGVRSLCDDESESPQAITRDYTIELLSGPEQAALLSVFGGKLTTYRKLAETVMKKLQPLFPQMGAAWTAKVALPGGDFSVSLPELCAELCQCYSFAPQEMIQRFVRQYGTLTKSLLKDCHAIEDLGQCFAPTVYQREIDHLIQYESVRKAEDLLWRRTKLGLYLSKAQQAQIGLYIEQRVNELLS